MRRISLIAACFLIIQTVFMIDLSLAKDMVMEKKDLPRAFLPKAESNVIIRKAGQSVSFWPNRATLEEVIERIAVEMKVTLEFHCEDPSAKKERLPDSRISADSVEKALRQLLPGEARYASFDRKGSPVDTPKDAATIRIYSKGCAGTDPPVRIFIAEREHPLARKPLEQVSLDEIRDLLRRGNPASRRQAADILGKKADERGIVLAKEALEDENPRVIFAAAGTLRRLGQKYGAEKVAEAVYGRYRERPYAELLPILAEVDKNRIWPVIDALDQAGEGGMAVIVRALVQTNDKRAIKYLSAISPASADISNQAIFGISKIGGPEAETALIKLLREGEGSRQAWAAQAVRFMKGDALEARKEVERIVREEKASDMLLIALAEVSYLEPLNKVLQDPASKPELKIRVLKALTAKGGERAIGVMSMGLNDKSFQVRLMSVDAMGRLAVEEAIPHLIRATADQEAKVRISAIKSLTEFPAIGNDPAVEALGKLIDDPDESVRRAAVDAFRLLGEPTEAMKTILNNCKKHKDSYVVSKAASILKYWGLE